MSVILPTFQQFRALRPREAGRWDDGSEEGWRGPKLVVNAEGAFTPLAPYPFLSTHPSAIAYIEARYTRLGNGMSFLASRLAVEWGGCPVRDVYTNSLLLSLCGPT